MDSRFPTHYLNDRRVLRLRPSAFRLFVMATAWSVSNMTDGTIEHPDLYLIPFANEDDPSELVDSGLWQKTEDGFHIVEFKKHQTSAAQIEVALENRKEKDRTRQANKRARDKDKPTDPTPSGGVSRDGHVTSEGEERQGEERQGKASSDVKVSLEEVQEEVPGWFEAEEEKRSVEPAAPISSEESFPDPQQEHSPEVRPNHEEEGGGLNGLAPEVVNRWRNRASA